MYHRNFHILYWLKDDDSRLGDGSVGKVLAYVSMRT